MNRTTLKQIIANGGATLNENGEAVTYKKGYQVSIKDCYSIPVYRLRYAMIKSLLNQAACVGVWIDKGIAYVDLSEFISTKKEALRTGKQCNQISIWNWKTSECIYC